MLTFDLTLPLQDFTVQVAGEVPVGVTAVFGPSGCGKTSLLRSVAGLEPAVGPIACNGQDWAVVPPHQRGVGMVFQLPQLFSHFDVRGNLRFAQKRALRAVDWGAVVEPLGLEPLLDRSVQALSGGEAQRVALGRALLAGPRVLLLDEPLSALDHRGKDDVLGRMAEALAGAEIPVLYVTHDITEVARMADQLWVMEAGRIARSGALEDVLSDPEAVKFFGRQQAGAVVTGRVGEYDPADDLTPVEVGRGVLWLPGRLAGPELRVRIPAHEVTLALEEPSGVSALSVLPAEVVSVSPGQGPGVAVALVSGDARFVARVTRRSAEALKLKPGLGLYAMIKATGLSHRDVGG